MSLLPKPSIGEPWQDWGDSVDTTVRALEASVAAVVSTGGTVSSGVYSADSGTSLQLPDTDVATISVIRLTANAALVFPPPGVGKSFRLDLVQDDTGSRIVVWPVGVRWTVPTLTTTAGRTDSFIFRCTDGASWIGRVDQQNIPASGTGIVTSATLATEMFAGTTGAAWPAQWTTAVSGAGAITQQSGKGRLSTAATAFGGGANAYLNGMTTTVDSEIYVEFSTDATANEQYLLVAARAGSATSANTMATNGYGVEIAESTGIGKIVKALSGSVTNPTSSVTVVPGGLATSATYALRFRLDAGRIRWRLWNMSGAEPGSWTQDYTDASSPYLTAGKMFVSAQNGSAATARSFDIDNVVVTDGTISANPSSPVVGIDLTVDDAALTYTGTGWQTGTDSASYLSGDHYTATTGDAASFTATYVAGATIAVRAKKASHHGNVNISIDGGAATTVDLYAASDAYQQTVYTSSTLAAGSHTITFTCAGTKNASSTGFVIEIDNLFLHSAVQGTTGNPPPTTQPPPVPPSTNPPSPTGFLTRSGNQVRLNGVQWRGVGVNMPWQFGVNPTRALTLAQQTSIFAAAQPNSIYRVFMLQNYGSLTGLDAVFNAARPYGHRFAVCMTDSGGGLEGRNDTFWSGGWISSGWRDSWLTTVVNRYKNEPLVGWWELCNEASPSTAFRSFADGFGAYVRGTLGDQHLIGTGCASEYGNSTGMRNLNASPYVDLCSMHEYDETQFPSAWAAADAADAASAGKPFYVGEYGIKPANNQASSITSKQNAYKAMSTCCAAIYWSVSAVNPASTDYEIVWNGSAMGNINSFSML